ncbi:MAG: hypothetical protein RL625_260 [Gemmatimonadota bacterium]
MLVTLLLALPAPWRPPALLLATWRRWHAVLGATLVSLLAIGTLTIERAELTMAILLYAPPILALLVMAGVFAHWRRPSVWTTIAQRRGAGIADGWRLLVLCAGLYLALLLPIALLALCTMPTVANDPTPALQRAAVFASAWSIVSFLTVATIAVLARRGVAGLTIAWMAVPAMLALAGPALGLSREILERLALLAPPFHAAARLHEVLMAGPTDLTARVLTHLLTFPILCAGLITFGLRRLIAEPATVDP